MDWTHQSSSVASTRSVIVEAAVAIPVNVSVSPAPDGVPRVVKAPPSRLIEIVPAVAEKCA